MGFVRKIWPGVAGVMLLAGSAPIMAEPPEPLAVIQLADPDPNYVPPPPETRHGRRHSDGDDRNETFDSAMQDFGRALGQAALMQQQVMQQRCKSSEAAAGNGQARMAWEAACKYTRR
jgi:hypothetical protein